MSFLEEATDYREHVFYRNNFTEREISYCLLQSNPKTSFTGLFAAKEAIVKAQNQFIGISFNELEIQHDKNGKPLFKNFDLSISHAGNLAVAVAVVSGQSMQDCKTVVKDVEAISPAGASNQKKFSILTILTLLLSLAAFALALLCYLKQ